jgi:hypothetical protein
VVTEQPVTRGRRSYEQSVRDYLADCELAASELEAAGSSLEPKYHPTENGAVKMIPHGGNPAEADKIREAFREVVQASPVPRLKLSAAQAEAETELEI